MENEGLRRWKHLHIDGGVGTGSRWHSTQRGLVRTSDVLGDHLVAALREAVRAGEGGVHLTFCAEDLMRDLAYYECESRLLVKLAYTGRAVQTVQRAIAIVLDVLNLRGSPEAETWRQQLREERDQRLQIYYELLADTDRLRTELGNEQQQLEVQTLLKSTFTKYGGLLTSGERDAMVAVLDASVRLSSVVVTAVPTWLATTEREWTYAAKSCIVGGEETCLRDVAMWATLQHPNVRKLYGACHVGEEAFAVHEPDCEVDNCSLVQCRPAFEWRLLLGCARGILYVHERGLVHESLTASHLLKQYYEAKGFLSGLGLVWSSTTDDALRGGSDEPGGSTTDSQCPSRSNDVMRLGILTFQKLVKCRAMDSHSLDPECVLKECAAMSKGSQQELPETSDMKPLPDTKPEFVSDDEWHLQQGMCATNPADRISMLDVVHQLSALTDQQESSLVNEEFKAELKTLVDIHQYVIPSLNETIEAVLGRADDLCAAAGPGLADLHRPVLKRLENIYQQLVGLASSPRLCLVERFVILLERWFCPLEHNMSFSLSQSSVGPLCASRTIAGCNYGLHHDIDRLLRDYSEGGLDSSAAVHQWQLSWEMVSQRQQQALASLVEEPSTILEGMESEVDRSEALALLQSEAQATGLRATGAPNALPKWFIPPHRVQLGKYLANGSFGAVYEGTYLDSPVVVKQVLASGLGVEERRQFQQEVGLWASLNHRNVIKLFGACHVGRPFFVCECAMGGTIVEHAKTLNDPAYVWGMLYSVSMGLQHLHDHGIVHGDLKGNNILVGDDSNHVKLADFGLSFVANQTDSSAAANDGALGAFRWKAPEVLKGGKATFASDIYSFGMCIIETMTGKPPWGNLISDAAVKYNVVERRLLPRRPKRFTDKQWELVTRMCCYDPDERITAGGGVGLIAQFL